jgi:hypothetical protein
MCKACFLRYIFISYNKTLKVGILFFLSCINNNNHHHNNNNNNNNNNVHYKGKCLFWGVVWTVKADDLKTNICLMFLKDEDGICNKSVRSRVLYKYLRNLKELGCVYNS